MKANQDFVAREIAGEYILVPVGEAALRIRGMICLSESGYLLYQTLQQECSEEDLVRAVRREYDVAPDVAEADVKAFLDQMRGIGLLVEG